MRPGCGAPLAKYGRVKRIRLNRLADDNLRQIISKVITDGRSLPADLRKRVLKRAEGVPLFAVELARFMMEHGSSASDRQIPATLSDLLTARLDQLGSAKKVAQVAAVIGDAAPLALISTVVGYP